eukprot:g35993.t1
MAVLTISKDGAVVVWRIDLNIAEAEHQLSDTSFYLPLDHDPTKEHQSLPTYIRKLHQFQNFQFAGSSCFFFTMDVSFLYMSIPNQDGLRALHFFLGKRPQQSSSITNLLSSEE